MRACRYSWSSREEKRRVERVLKFCPDILVQWRRAVTLPGGFNKYLMDRDGVSGYEPSEQGTGLSYTYDRLKRDFPRLYARVVAGTMSANAAAIKAGFRKRSTPLQQIVRLLPKLKKSEKQKLRAMLK